MNKRNMLRMFISILAASSLSLTGCAVRREAGGISLSEDSTVTVEEAIGKVYRVEYKKVKCEDVFQAVFGISEQEARETILDSSTYILAGEELCLGFEGKGFVPTSGDDLVDNVYYINNNEGAFYCYDAVIMSDINEWLFNDTLRRNLPLENLNSCTKEEAIEACRPYAEAIGYGEDTVVSAYAITADMLDKKALKPYGDLTQYQYWGAPDPEYDVSSRDMFAASDKGIPWEEKHEVMLLTYQPYFEGILMEETFDLLQILYVPMYEKPIWMIGFPPYQAVELLEEKPLISKEDAVSRAMRIKGHNSAEELEVKQISLLYALQEVFEGDSSWQKMIPCWCVEYLYKEKEYRVLVDAIYGDKYQRFPES